MTVKKALFAGVLGLICVVGAASVGYASAGYVWSSFDDAALQKKIEGLNTNKVTLRMDGKTQALQTITTVSSIDEKGNTSTSESSFGIEATRSGNLFDIRLKTLNDIRKVRGIELLNVQERAWKSVIPAVGPDDIVDISSDVQDGEVLLRIAIWDKDRTLSKSVSVTKIGFSDAQLNLLGKRG